MRLVFTTVYERKVRKLLSARERTVGEDEIARDPTRWPILQGTGGLRKARVARGSSGKSSGARVIYYFWVREDLIYFLTVYSKSTQSDISPDEKKALKSLVQTLQRGHHGNR